MSAAAFVIECAKDENNEPVVRLIVTVRQPPARILAGPAPTDPADLAAYMAGREAIADAACAALADALAAGLLDGLPS